MPHNNLSDTCEQHVTYVDDIYCRMSQLQVNGHEFSRKQLERANRCLSALTLTLKALNGGIAVTPKEAEDEYYYDLVELRERTILLHDAFEDLLEFAVLDRVIEELAIADSTDGDLVENSRTPDIEPEKQEPRQPVLSAPVARPDPTAPLTLEVPDDVTKATNEKAAIINGGGKLQ